MIFTIDADDDDRRDQVNEWFDASTRDRIAEALLDENGLRPTDAMMDVLMDIIDALEDTDANWIATDAPKRKDYAESVFRMVDDYV